MADVDQVDYDPAVDPVYEDVPAGGSGASNEGQANSSEGPTLPRGVIPHVLFVSRFSPNTTPEDVKALMETYGPVRGMVHKTTVAFIEFENPEHAFTAKHSLHRTPALGSESLVVDFKKNNTGVKNFDSEEQFMDNTHDERGRRDRGRDRDRERERERERDRRFRHDDRRREERPDRPRGPDYRVDYRDDRRERGDSRDFRDSRDLRDPRDYRDPRDMRDPRDRMGPPPMDDRFRGPMRPDHPPVGYPPAHGYRPDDRRIPYGAEPPMYRGGSPSRGPPHQGGLPPRTRSPPRSPPRDEYDDRRPPIPYDDRRGPKRSFDGPAGPDYRFGGPPLDARGGPLDERGPPVDARGLPPHLDSRGHPGDYYPPRGPPPPMRYDIPSQGKYSEARRPVEPSAYAAGANRPRDFERGPPPLPEGNGRYPAPEGAPMSGHPMSSRPMRDGPLRGEAYPPARRDVPPPESMPPHGRLYPESRPDFRGPGDDYGQGPKRPRY